MSTHHREVVVIGGGQAGLAIGHFLAQQGRRFTILEAADAPAAAWRERWDSLRLFTPARFDSLPGKPFPGDPDRYPTRDEVVGYLTDYARDLPVELSSRVRKLRRDDARYRVELDDRTYEADQVVIATGPFQTPRIPALAARLAPDVHQLHSAAYRNPAQIPAGPVLVVGGGNTGYQIAEELATTHEVHLAVGSQQKPLPQRILGHDIFRYLNALGAVTKTADTRIGRRMKKSDALVGSSPRRARRKGVNLHPRATGASGSTVTFADGSGLPLTTVIWATGFALDHAWIDVPVFGPDGTVIQQRGVTPAPGLYFLGLPWMHTRGSALLGWVKDDAAHVAARIAAHAPTPLSTKPLALAA
jgi:putative flavoprotein involved in K+ transport